MDRAWTLDDIKRISRYGPRIAAAYPWVRLIQKMAWQYGPEGALARLNEGRRAAA